MRKTMPILLTLFLGAAGAGPARSQEDSVAQRFGLNIQAMVPSDTAGKLYNTGYSVSLPIYFRMGEPVEGRLRLEVGHFGGKTRSVPGGSESVSADTRFVGYDWLIRIGETRAPGVDFIVGIGGARWYQTLEGAYVAGSQTTTRTDSDYGDKAAFVLTLGFAFHVTRNVGFEAKQMLTSLPGSHREFTDADLSHTSLGVAFRF